MDPEWVFGLGKSLSKRVALRHDYMPFEFCVYIYKSAEVNERYVFADVDQMDGD